VAVGFVLLVGCGPHVEEEDDFVERQCEIWCDGVEPCEHLESSWTECFDECFESERWTEPCREDRAAYHDCLLALTCEELEERGELVLEGQSAEDLACYEESFAASYCVATR